MKKILALLFLCSLPTAAETITPAAVRQLTHFAGEDREPSPSPDGRMLAYLSDPLGNRENQLWVMDLKTGESRVLVQTLSLSSPTAWRVDSSGLIFAASTDGAPPELMETDLEGSKPLPLLPQPDGRAHMAPSLSPDGKLLAFSRLLHAPSNWDIVLLDMETATEIPLKTNSQYREVWPRFMPDGKSLLYFSRADSGGIQDELYRMGLSSGLVSRLTLNDSHDFTPAPSPDGKWIAFISNRAGKPQLYVMPSAGGEARHIDTGGKRAGHPAWSADGKSIFVTLREDGKTGDIFALMLP